MTDVELLNEEAAEKRHLQQERLQQKSRLMMYLSFAFVLSTAFVVYLYFVNVAYKKQLLEQQEKLIEQQAIISAQKNEMSAFIDSLASQLHSRNDYATNATPGTAAVIDPGAKATQPAKPAKGTLPKPGSTATGTSPSRTDSQPATPASKPAATAQQVQQVAKIDRLLERSINSKYYVGLHTFNASDAQIQQLQQYLKEQGYFFDETSYHYKDSKPSWMAYEPTVFYYSPDSREKATMLARELYKQTNIRFAVKQGAGLGVVAGQEAFTFYIHLINR